jgi:hypothetical protein
MDPSKLQELEQLLAAAKYSRNNNTSKYGAGSW